MARSYGTILTSVWNDQDFLRLSADARLTFLMLVTQTKISAVGVLEVKPRKWATNCGFTVDQLEKALAELVEHDYVVIDDATDELLVRSFVRHDNGYTNGPRLRAIVSATKAIESVPLQVAVGIEMDRLNLTHDLPGRDPLQDTLNGPGQAPDQDAKRAPSEAPREGASGVPSQASSHAPYEAPGVVVVTEAVVAPQPTTHNPQPASLDPATLDPAPAVSSSLIVDADDTEVVDAEVVNDDEIGRPEVVQLCNQLADRIEANGSKRPTVGKAWLQQCRLMLDTDGRTVAQVAWMIDWAQADPFWRSNIMSMPKLRQQFDQLRLKAMQEHQRRQERTAPRRTTDDKVRDGEALVADLQRRESAAGAHPIPLTASSTPGAQK